MSFLFREIVIIIYLDDYNINYWNSFIFIQRL